MKVTAETVYVLVPPHTLTKTPIPPPLRAALEKGAPGLVTDHSGDCQKLISALLDDE